MSPMIVRLTLLVAVGFGSTSVSAWGGLFNRFNPSMLSNLGYGSFGGGASNYGKELFGAALTDKEMPDAIENALEEEAALEAAAKPPKKVMMSSMDVCSGKTCTANEHCCEGHVCVDTDEISGTCLPTWGKKQGDICYRDNECESGFLCVEDSGQRSCQAPSAGHSGLGDDCSTSSDCDISRGLCCKLHRRAKSRPKKICSYFTDPLVCIGPVAMNQVMTSMEHTAGEKRISGHPDDHLHYRK